VAKNVLDGGSGNDDVSAIAEALKTGDGAGDASATNYVTGEGGRDHLTGAATASNDSPFGSAIAMNELDGSKGDDSLEAVATATGDVGVFAQNELLGGSGNDHLEATANATGTADVMATNHLDGGSGDDTLVGIISEDTLGFSDLFGDTGDDDLTAIGGEGNVLEGGRGDDNLRGSSGQDNFVYEGPPSGNLGWDTIFGFEDNKDKVVLEGYTSDDLSIDNARNVATLSDGTRITFADFEGVLNQDDFVFVDTAGIA